MKLFKKALAAVLLGAMALTMTACWGWGAPAAGNNKTSQAVAAAGKTNTYSEESTKALNALVNVVAAEDSADEAVKQLQEMKEFSFASATASEDAKYDLYIWTNGIDKKSPLTGKYPYLHKLTNTHVSQTQMMRLLAKEFIAQGNFKGTSEDYQHLKQSLANAKKDVGITITNVQGTDVLVVVVEKGDTVNAVYRADAPTPAEGTTATK